MVRAPLVLVALSLAVAAPQPASKTTVTASAVPYVRELNLDFEAANPGGVPVAWFAGGEGYVARLDSSQKKDGDQSLRLSSGLPPRAGAFGVATGTFPVADARGGRLRLSGWIRTDAVTGGWAGLWMRVDGPGGVLAFDNMQPRGIVGTTPWTRYEIVLEVAAEATNINFGALLTGSGTAWIDALRFELLPPASPVTISGTVRDGDGRPVAGAVVAVTSGMRTLRARTDAHGQYSVVTPPGNCTVTATSALYAAGYVKRESAEVDTVIDVRLGGPGFAVSGRATDDSGAAAPGVPVGFVPSRAQPGQLFFTETDATGRYQLTLPAAERYVAEVDSPSYDMVAISLEGGAARVLDLSLVRRGPAPDAAVDWIRSRAVPLKTVEAGHGFEDMEPLRAIVGDARVVALGEATHGSREFFQLKHRMLEFLVERMGFTVFGIEANWPESLALDDYVVNGRGDARAGLAGIYFWTWNTEEVLDLVEWMRRYNADPAHPRKLRFYGFDMQTPAVAVERVLEYLRAVDPEQAAPVAEALAPARDRNAYLAVKQLAADRAEALKKAVAELLARFDARRNEYVGRSGEAQWTLARQHLVIVRQALDTILPGNGPGRDESMAENVRWLLDHEPAGTRMVLWAHNGHVGRSSGGGFRPMGAFLGDALGAGYLTIGFAFGRGSFQAIDFTKGPGKPGGLGEHTVGPPPATSIDAAFERTTIPLFALDLRARQGAAPVPAWFSVPRPMREIGAVFSSAEAMLRPVVLPQTYDAVLFVRETTRARPIVPPQPPTRTD